MVRLLFSMYIRSSHVLSHSSPAVGELWRLLSKFALRWCHRLTFVENWSTACYCLTRELFFCVSGSAGEESEATNVDLCVDWGGRSTPVKVRVCESDLRRTRELRIPRRLASLVAVAFSSLPTPPPLLTPLSLSRRRSSPLPRA